jgi:3-deoxy-D-manno-octulosonic acid (KDO) 8-phosphate synthase
MLLEWLYDGLGNCSGNFRIVCREIHRWHLVQCLRGNEYSYGTLVIDIASLPGIKSFSLTPDFHNPSLAPLT